MKNIKQTLTLLNILLTAAFVVAPLRLLAQALPPANAAFFPASDRNVVYFGRWDRSDPAVAHSHWGGAYLRTRFTGNDVWLKMADGEALGVSIDGEPIRAVGGQAGLTPLNLRPLGAGLHTLLVGPSCGGEAKVQGLVLDPGGALKAPVPRPIIEFVGDSITWGTGPDGLWNVNHTWMAAEALGCDHTQVAQSARALTTGYGCADEKTGMDKQYFMLKNFGYVHDVPQLAWDFSTYTPSIIVINLGQNDACGNEPDDVFTASYVSFVKHIRTKFPHAQIVALRMFGGGHFGQDTQKAVSILNADGDPNVHFISTEGWLQPSDFADGVHPNAGGNWKAAVRLAPLLKPLLGADAPKEKTVGDPANPNGLPQAIINAYIGGERHITITPGTYLLSNPGDSLFHLSHWQDAVISANKVTLIINNGAGAGTLFSLDNCDNVTVAGPVTSQTAQTAYQGRVLSIDTSDPHNQICVWRPSAGYPVPPDGTKELWINVVDAKSKTINTLAGDYYHASLTPLGDGSYRIGLESRHVNFHVGDYIVARCGDPPAKFHLTGSHNCTLQDVTLMRNGFAPIFEGEGGGNHYLRVHWALGPRPAGATEDPVVTNAADGLHSPDCDPGPDIENCIFDGVFLDDCIAIHGVYNKIVSANGPVIVAHNGYAYFTVGEPVRISNDHGFYLQANVTALKDNGDGTSTLTLDANVPIPLDVSLSNPLHDGHGYKVIGCRLGNTRSRGIIAKADDGVIENNVITHCGLGLRLGPEWPSEADYSQHVTVTGNTLANNFDGLVIDGSGAKENRDITIQGNRFAGNLDRDISVAWADGVTLTGNSFTAPSIFVGGKPKASIFVHDSDNVNVTGNHVSRSRIGPEWMMQF